MQNIIDINRNYLKIINNGNCVDFVFEEAYFDKLKNRKPVFDINAQIFEIISNEFNKSSYFEQIENGFRLTASEIYENEESILLDLIGDYNKLSGVLKLVYSGLNTASPGFDIKIQFFPYNSSNSRPFITAGLFLELPGNKYLLNKAEEQAFRAYRDYKNLKFKTQHEHLDLIAKFKSLSSDNLKVDLGRFEQLEITEISDVGLNVTRLESGDLLLEPNLIGLQFQNETILNREIQIASTKDYPTTLYLGNKLAKVGDQQLEGLKEVYHKIIPKEDAQHFLETPASFIDPEKVNIEFGFSYRVNGLSFFTRVQNYDIDSGNNDWFNSSTPIIVENFEDSITNILELEEFIEKVKDANFNNAQAVLIDGKQVNLPNKEEFEIRVVKLKKALYEIALVQPDEAKLPSKPKTNQVSFEIKYFDEDFGLASLYQPFTPNNSVYENLYFQPLNHQEEAINWIYSLYRNSLASDHKINGGILADDMGLGKTFTSLMGMKSILEYCKYSEEAEMKCFMVVAPLSLLENWKSEVFKFFKTNPFYDVVILNSYADLDRFKLESGTELKLEENKESQVPKSTLKYKLKVGEHFSDQRLDIPGRLILITYETLRNFQFSMASVPFSCVVFDEAQKIKNPNALATRAAKALDSDLNIIATGTPVENNLEEYWCLMDTANPNLFGTKKEFEKQYVLPIKKQSEPDIEIKVGKELYKRSGPFLLRRTKEELKDKLGQKLPEKIEYKGLESDEALYLNSLDKILTNDQISIYEKIRLELTKAQHLGDFSKNLIHLKSCMLHPKLVFNKGLEPIIDLTSDEFWKGSAKLEALNEILDFVKRKGEKLIIFLISRNMQYLLKMRIRNKFGIDPDIISGETKVQSFDEEETRMGMIKKFSEMEGFNVIILSPLAAGVGLNVTAANHVFHLERHWNPAKEAQANDRVYRIGQEKQVSIYYPISKHPKFDSFDIKLDNLLSRKSFIKDALITYPRISENEVMKDLNLEN
ncbi:DEAD/DEAH box helicase [Robiginitalea sp.]|nr:DEAD/DEAH box helicase [Robiginitalea sp.]